MEVLGYGGMILAILLIVSIVLYIKMLHRCDSDQVMVKSGAFIGNESCKIYMGGTTIVVPLLQSVRYLSRAPISIPIIMEEAISKNKIRVKVPCNFQVALADQPQVVKKAASTIVGMGKEEQIKKVKEILTGGLRAVIATLTIEEINDDRSAFVESVDKQVRGELTKLGLEITNVNIEEIDDEAGYLKALGQKAAAAALNQANIQVAEQDKLGRIGVETNEAARDVEIQNQQTKKAVGTANAIKDKQVQVAEAEAETAVLKIEFEKRRLKAESDLAEAEAEKSQIEDVAKSRSQQEIIKQQTVEEELRRRKDEVVDEKIKKEKLVIEAEAKAESVRIAAKAEAEAITIVAEARAKEVESVLLAQADGYKKLFDGTNNNAILGMEQLKIAENLESIRAKAISGIKIDEMKIIDSGSGKSVPNFMDGFLNSLPKTHAISDAIGITAPAFLGTAVKQEDKKVTEDSSEEDTE